MINTERIQGQARNSTPLDGTGVPMHSFCTDDQFRLAVKYLALASTWEVSPSAQRSWWEGLF